MTGISTLSYFDKLFKKLEKDGDISKDEQHNRADEIQKLTDGYHLWQNSSLHSDWKSHGHYFDKKYNKILSIDNNKDRFAKIYEYKLWSSLESTSGIGSRFSYTQNLRAWLPKIINKYHINVIVDAACGDFNWMKIVLNDVNVTYYGFDIVDSIISKNNKLYANEKIKFKTADICLDRLPNCDLLIARDCLFHFSYCDIDNFLKNIELLDYKYLLTTSHIVEDGFVNSDIVTGGFRLVDLFNEPFCFNRDAVIDRVDDFPPGFAVEREMVLFQKEDVPVCLSNT